MRFWCNELFAFDVLNLSRMDADGGNLFWGGADLWFKQDSGGEGIE